MKVNSKGLVEASSVRDAKRISLKLKESDTLRLRLIKARNYRKVLKGEIAVIDDREFLRVTPSEFNGPAWLEIEEGVTQEMVSNE